LEKILLKRKICLPFKEWRIKLEEGETKICGSPVIVLAGKK